MPDKWVVVQNQLSSEGEVSLSAGTLVEIIGAAEHLTAAGDTKPRGFMVIVKTPQNKVYAVAALGIVAASKGMWLRTDEGLINVLSGRKQRAAANAPISLKNQVIIKKDGGWLNVMQDGRTIPLFGSLLGGHFSFI